MSKPPLLDLDTLITRPTIKIDGIDYEILSPEELSVLDSQRFTNWGAQLEELGKDPKKEDELIALVDETARKVMVGVPEAVVDKLTDSKKMSVLEVFTALLLRRKLGMAGAVLAGTKTATDGEPTGEKSSPGSSASTEAIPPGGLMKHLGRWFARS